MKYEQNRTLSELTTMRLGGEIAYFTEFSGEQDIRDIYSFAREHELPVWILGGGSNTIGRDEGFSGIVARCSVKGFQIILTDSTHTTIRVGGGENWNDIVERTVEMGLSGIEALVRIPGTVGASPVQNIGAYGQEVSETIVSVEAYDTYKDVVTSLSNDMCGFRYRDSIFKSDEPGRYVILYVTFRLSTTLIQPPYYASIQKYLEEHPQEIASSRDISAVVATIRGDKLPDPSIIANSGSFFKNAIITQEQLQTVLQKHPQLPHYAMPDGTYKVPTGWLIDQCNLKGYEQDGMEVYPKNALVLTNISAKQYRALASIRQHIHDRVYETFGIHIEQEPVEVV